MNRRDTLKGLLGLPFLIDGLLKVKPVVPKVVVPRGVGLYAQIPKPAIQYVRLTEEMFNKSFEEYLDSIKEMKDTVFIMDKDSAFRNILEGVKQGGNI